MKFFYFPILMLVGTEISAYSNVIFGDDVSDNDDSMKMYQNQAKLKWNYDPSDMLNFDKSEVHAVRNDEIQSILNDRQEESAKCMLFDAKKSELDLDKVVNYTVRYINLLLYFMELQNDEAVEASSKTRVNFDFVLTSEDLSTLKHLSKNISKKTLFDGLYMIDDILSRSVSVRQDSSFVLPNYLNFKFLKELHVDKGNVLFLIFGMIYLVLVLMRSSPKFKFMVLINSWLMFESYWKYLDKLKKAEIMDHVDKLKYSSMENPCLQQQSYFSRIYNWFTEDQCYKYYEVMETTRSSKVSLLESMLDTYGFYLLEMPSKTLGSCMKTFSVSLNGYLHPLISPFATFFTICILIGCIIIVIICMLRPRLRLSLPGANMEFGFSSENRNPQTLPERKEEPVQYYRILQLPKIAMKAVGKRSKILLPENKEKDTATVSEDVENMEKNEAVKDEDSDLDENIWVHVADEEYVKNDAEVHLSEKPNLSQDIKIAKTLISDLKKSDDY